MKIPTQLRFRHLVLGTGLAFLAACSAETQKTAAVKSSADATAEAPSMVSGDATPEKAATDTARAEGSPPVLDTEYDLSKLAKYPGASSQIAGESPSQDVVGPTPATGDATDPGQAPAAPTGPTPNIRFAEGQADTQEFGEVLQGIKADATFRMVAEGEVDLVISRIKASCGCTAADVKLVNGDGTRTVYQIGDPIAPGTEFEIDTSIVTDGRQGPMSTYVTIYSNEARGFVNLHLKADVLPVLKVEPPTLNFGPVTSADRVEGSVTVVSDVLDPFMLSVDEQFVVEPLSVELVPTDPDAEGRAKAWTIKVALGPQIPEGLRNYPIVLKTDAKIPHPKEDDHGHDHGEGEADHEHVDPTYDGRLFVQAQVTGLVNAAPSFLSYGMVRPGQILERTVKIACHDEFELSEDLPIRMTGLRGEEFPYPDRFSTTLTKQEDGSLDMVLRLEGMPDDLTGSFGGVVEIEVGHPTKDVLQVRFSGICKPGLQTPAQPTTNGTGEGH